MDGITKILNVKYRYDDIIFDESVLKNNILSIPNNYEHIQLNINQIDNNQLLNRIFDKINTFIIIGAMDGITHDNIFDYIQTKYIFAVFIEPVEYQCNILKENIKTLNGEIYVENEAISDKNETLDIIYLNPDYKNLYDYWMDGCSTVLINNVPLNSDISVVKKEHSNITTKNALTIVDIFNKYNLNQIDYIQIDTEGYDERIVHSILDYNIDVKIIKFEYTHTTLNIDDLIKKLDNYIILNDGMNILCIRIDFAKTLGNLEILDAYYGNLNVTNKLKNLVKNNNSLNILISDNIFDN